MTDAIDQSLGDDVEAVVRRALSRSHMGVKPPDAVLDAAKSSKDARLIALALIAEGTYDVVSCDMAAARLTSEKVQTALSQGTFDLHPNVEWSWLFVQFVEAAQRLDWRSAERFIGEAVALGELVSEDRRTNALLQLGRCYLRQDRLRETIEALSELQHRNPDSGIVALVIGGHLAELFHKHGHWERSRMHLESTLGPGAFNQPMLRSFFGSQLVATLIDLDELEEARSVAADVRSNAVRTGWKFPLGLSALADSRVALACGDSEQSLEFVESALDLLRLTGNQYEEMEALLHQAKALLAVDRHQEAEAVLDDDRVLVMGPFFMAKVERLRAECCRAQGRWEEVVRAQRETRRLRANYADHFPDLYAMMAERYRLDEADARWRVLETANLRLQAAHAEKDELRSIVAHDLQSPLTALGLTLEFLSLQTNEDRARARLATASETVSRVRGIADQLTTLKEVDSGAVEFQIEPVQIGPVLGQTVRQFESAAGAKNINLTIEDCVDRWEELLVCADVVRFAQVLDNLVSNALKYSPPGGRVTVACRHQLLGPGPDAPRIEISVVDNGLGMSPEDLDGLFQKYGRLSSRPTGQESSSGVGLYIAQSFATSMGGEIRASSDGKGAGSTFVLSLPAAEGQFAVV